MKAFCIGMHRSGTSLLARLINLMGVSLGPSASLLAPQPDNPKGFWENREVMEINDALFALAGAAWNRPQNFAPKRLPPDGLVPLEARAAALLEELGHSPDWLLKDPRFCLTLPFWTRLAPGPVIIHAVRHPLRVALSLHKRDRLPLAHGLALWEHHVAAALRNTRGLPCLYVEYQSVARDPWREIARIENFLRDHGAAVATPGKAGVEAFLDYAPRRIATPKAASLLTPGQERLWNDLAAAADGGPAPEPRPVSAASRDLLRLGGRALLAAERLRSRADFISPDEAENAREKQREEFEQRLGGMRREHAQEKRSLEQEAARSRNTVAELRERLAEANRMQTELTRTRAERETLRDELREVRQGAQQALSKECAARKEAEQALSKERAARKEAGQTLARMERDIWTLRSWMEQCGEAGRALSRSWSWRLGNAPMRFCCFLLGRRNDSALTHLAGLQRDYDDWRLRHDQLAARAAALPPAGIADLLRRALAAPGRALRLLTFERAVNFWRTLFCQDRERRTMIFRHYIELLGGSPRQAAIPACVPGDGPRPLPQCDAPEVSIIIPAYNQWAFTSACIRSILGSGTRTSYEILLADDASTDETQQAGEMFPGLVVIRGQDNVGFLRNCNRAARHARAPFLMFLNNDTEVRGDWLTPLFQLMSRHGDIGICGSKLVYADGELQEAGGIIWRDGSGWNYGRLGDPEAPQYNYVKEADYISGASILVRGDFWRRAGGFDERYAPAYYEDADLAFKAREAGLRVVYNPLSVVTHHEGKSHGTDTASGLKRHQVSNRETFTRRWAGTLEAEHFPNGENVFRARDRSRSKNTVLVIDHYVPHYDQDAGSKTTFQHMRLLARAGYSVKFLGENFFRHEPYTTTLQQMGVEVLYGDEMARHWRDWLAENGRDIDVVLLNRPHITDKFLDACRQSTSARLLYYGHDLHFLRKQREYELSGLQRDIEEARHWRTVEERIFHAVDEVLTCSSVELSILRERYPEVSSALMPPYVYETLPPSAGGYETRSDLFFVGGFGHPPNLDGVSWFLDEVFPLVLQRRPETIFWCAGSNMPKALFDRAAPNVRMLGQLTEEELTRQLAVRRVNVVPLRYGAGVKGKVVEALANGMLLAATSTALEGLPGVEACCPPRDGAEDLAAEICRLLLLPAGECEALAARERDYVWRHFSERAAARALVPVIGSRAPLERFLERLEENPREPLGCPAAFPENAAKTG